ncbi:sensor histidine kinase [Arabiibacter massiliensis]|uniref:sensor histidine kinase n=1 Tax=Arabiibacter massiliensis TaxID=1870985 RepID=UPI000B425BA5|nr:histidine kinase [Arabiibacter massiliensis]
MSAAASLIVAVEAFGGLLSFVLAACLLLVRGQDRHENRLIVCAFVLGGAAQLLDMTAWLVEGRPGPVVHAAMNATVFFTYACDFAFMGVLVQYLASYVGAHDPRVSARRITKICWSMVAAMIALLVLNQFFPVFYSFDELNVYRETVLWEAICQGALMLFPAYGLAVAARSRQLLNPFVATVLIAGPLVMMAVLIGQNVAGDLPLSYLAVTVCTVLLYLGVQQEQARTFATRQLAIEQHETNLLISQIRPHFLYNVITTIYGLVDVDPQVAQNTVREFSAFLRANMDALACDGPVPFAKELSHVRAFLALERRRFGDRIVVVEDLGPTDFAIPALTVQPLVENAVRHGLTGCDTTLTVRISTRERPDGYEVEVSDDGAGFDPARLTERDGRTHVGLESVRERVTRLAGGTLEVSSSPHRGATALVRLPKTLSGLEGEKREDRCENTCHG